MNLEKKFAKELAGNLRKETADKLREARKKPSSFGDFRKSNISTEEYRYHDTKEGLEKIKKNIWGRIFKTQKFRQEEKLINESLRIEKKYNIDDIKKDYEKKFAEILKNSPLTEEENKIYLSTESMEKMSLEDMLTLLKRLSGEAFYHVTQFGVRENTFISTGGGHEVKKGEYVDSFFNLLKDGYIKDCTTTVISDKERAGSLINQEFIKEQIKEGKTAEEIVDKALSEYGTQYFLDKESTHFSYGKDLHHMYGGENDYKFYFYYPVEYILQNDFYHSTRESQITIGQGYYYNSGGIKQQYNDFEIFNFGKGVPINAGILCITGDVQVDPRTGSQYIIENGKPAVDENGDFKKPEHTIPSKEYWENYFSLHPELKPSKIIYGSFYTFTNDENEELKKLAKSKEIYNQNEETKQSFLDYKKESFEKMRESLIEVIKEKYF